MARRMPSGDNRQGYARGAGKLTFVAAVVIDDNMKAALLLRRRIALAEDAFAELVLWSLPRSVPGSAHPYKYRLAFVVRGECVLRYDNEAGKGDHTHFGDREEQYRFVTADRLVSDFMSDIRRWMDENSQT